VGPSGEIPGDTTRRLVPIQKNEAGQVQGHPLQASWGQPQGQGHQEQDQLPKEGPGGSIEPGHHGAIPPWVALGRTW
jgi:hypothetical protein